jgi:patatin-like phospholipase/acyl hydrolase
MLLPNKKNNSKEEKIEERYILSIDGGGMRGIIPAIVISKLAEELKDLNEDKPFYSFFDLIAGTSTGGLIALGLTTSPLISNLKKEEGEDHLITYETKPLTFFERLRGKKEPEVKQPKLITKGSDCSTLLDFYKNDGKSIFHAESRFLGQLLKDKYDPKHIEGFLNRTFKNAKINQCLVPTMVVSYDASEGIPFNFKSWDDNEFTVAQAARATSAAPTYFPPAIVYDKKEDKRRYLIDGGIIANNPVLMAYSEARKLYPNCKKFHILALSTASNDYAMEDVDVTGGLMGWIDPSKGAPIQKISATSQMQLASFVANNISDVEYTRIHYNLKGDSFKLDDTSSYAVNTLIDSGEQLFREEEEKLISFLKKMIKREDFSHVLDINNLEIEEEIKTEASQINPLEIESKLEETPILEENETNKQLPSPQKRKYFFSKKNNGKTPINIKSATLSSILDDDKVEKTPQNEKYQEVLDKYGLNEEDLK